MASSIQSLRAGLARRSPLLIVSIAGGLVAAAFLLRAAGFGAFYQPLMAVAAVIAGWSIAAQAIGQLRLGQLGIPLLVTLAAVGALIIGEAWEAAAVTFLFALGNYLEGITLSRTRSALHSLMELAPQTARVKRGEEIEVISAFDVQPGETVVVLPGDRVPVDGRVLSGRAVLDTAAVTGEPMPQEAGPESTVLGGSVSRSGYLEVLAERVGADSTFSRLLYLVAEAQEQKPQVQRVLDRFARWYTPAVIAAAVLVYGFTRDIELALTFLVIGCPGALLMASPVATVAGIGRAARQGVLIKGGERLERIGRVDVLAFDKTGTLTLGQPKVTQVVAFGAGGVGPGGNAATVLALAAAAEQRSEHHLAMAILEHARSEGVTPAPADDWTLEPGLGATAHSRTAHGPTGEILVGNRRLLAAHGLELTPEQEAQVAAHEAAGETVALVAAAGQAQGFLSITDPLRPEAAELVDGLRRVGIRHTVMLTGDNPAAAERVASRLGIDEVRAGLLPADKVTAIRELQAKGHRVAMIGDGINDAPALAAADVAIAMGVSGTQAAIETADIALMADRLDRVPYAIGLSRQIVGVVRQNVAIAVITVLLLLAGVVGRVVLLGGGMLVHEASVLAVILNGMRLLRPGRSRQ
ncbi:MAG: heavy metal translocating P-type ATPase [Symbiobacteriia bacterium]